MLIPLMVADRGVGVCQPSVPVNRLTQPARKGEKKCDVMARAKPNPSRNHAFLRRSQGRGSYCAARKFLRDSPDRQRGARMELRFHPGPTMGQSFSFPGVTTPHPGEPRMSPKSITAKLRLRLALTGPAARLRRLSAAELILCIGIIGR